MLLDIFGLAPVFRCRNFVSTASVRDESKLMLSVPCTQGALRCSTFSIHVSGENTCVFRTRLSHRNKRNSSAVAAVDRETLHFISVRPSSTRKLPYQVSTGFHSMALHSIQGHVVSHLLILVLCFTACLIQLP